MCSRREGKSSPRRQTAPMQKTLRRKSANMVTDRSSATFGAEADAGALSAERVQARYYIGRKVELCRGEIFAQVIQRGRSGNEQNVGCAREQPCECDLPRRRVEHLRHRRQRIQLKRRQAP